MPLPFTAKSYCSQPNVIKIRAKGEQKRSEDGEERGKKDEFTECRGKRAWQKHPNREGKNSGDEEEIREENQAGR